MHIIVLYVPLRTQYQRGLFPQETNNAALYTVAVSRCRRVKVPDLPVQISVRSQLQEALHVVACQSGSRLAQEDDLPQSDASLVSMQARRRNELCTASKVSSLIPTRWPYMLEDLAENLPLLSGYVVHHTNLRCHHVGLYAN